MDRRMFLRGAAAACAGAVGVSRSAKSSGGPVTPSGSNYAVLTDISKCIGCRKCEYACNQEPTNEFEEKKEMAVYEDFSVFETHRRHSPDSLTVVNRFQDSATGRLQYVKSQCNHCLDPACLSACLVTAFHREANGTVTYDAGRCMGCRYCIVACPFQVPSYEYEKALTPRVRKCTLCFRDRTSRSQLPACVEICPVQCMTFGPREEILKFARATIESHPGDYVDHIYGEHEVGGTTWMYISHVPFEELGFLSLPHDAPPRLLEGIQHSIFRYFIPPVMFFGLLGLVMWNFKPEDGLTEHSGEPADRPSANREVQP